MHFTQFEIRRPGIDMFEPVLRLCSEEIDRWSEQAGRTIDVPRHASARFGIGDVVRHRMFDFRGVIFDIDPVFANSEEWYQSIPEHIRPHRDQPFYHLLAENDESYYIAYVSEGNLVADYSGEPVTHPDIPDLFWDFTDGHYPLHFALN